MRHTVVLTAHYPSVARDILAPLADLVEHPTEQERTEDDVITILSEADAAIALLSDPLTRRADRRAAGDERHRLAARAAHARDAPHDRRRGAGEDETGRVPHQHGARPARRRRGALRRTGERETSGRGPRRLRRRATREPAA